MRENCLSGGNGGLGSGDRVILFSTWEDLESGEIMDKSLPDWEEKSTKI